MKKAAEEGEHRRGGLMLVATPIGNLGDITVRAIEILRSADVVASEDTRRTGKLLKRHAISSRQISFHEHNERAAGKKILALLKEGKTVALVTNAGTPVISDPGFTLVRDDIGEGIEVTMAFRFRGFPPRKPGPRRRFLEADVEAAETLVYYESPHRLGAFLKDALEVLGDRRAALAVELTKLHESVERGTLSELVAMVEGESPRGEYTVVVEGRARRKTRIQTPKSQERPGRMGAPSSARQIETSHGPLLPPAFLPDATRGVVRGLTAGDLSACGVRAVVMNVFHLMRNPGVTAVEALGGLHAMSGWSGPIVTDSGGFQAFSLIRQDPRKGRIDDKGILYRPDEGGKKVQLSPEKSVELQLRLGADVVICLDDCTHVDDPLEAQEVSVRRTIDWARRGKTAFEAFLGRRKPASGARPLLFAVIQGGGSEALRKSCAEGLLEIGFDGFGYGGWPLGRDGAFLEDLFTLVRELVPPSLPLFALGVGHPDNVTRCASMGYDLFDSSMPSKDARHGRLYLPAEEGKTVSFLYVGDDGHRRDGNPISEDCDCLACATLSRGYLNHLYRVRDPLYVRLSTMHNLAFMARILGGGSEDGDEG
jgi:queuine tRNA-ribosyltransferase